MVSSGGRYIWYRGNTWRRRERAEALGNSERQTEEMKERMLEPESERGTQRAAKRHEELLGAILQ